MTIEGLFFLAPETRQAVQSLSGHCTREEGEQIFALYRNKNPKIRSRAAEAAFLRALRVHPPMPDDK